MFTTPQQLIEANAANLEAALTIANTACASTERITALNLNTARTFLADSVANATTLLSVKNVQEFFAVQSALAQPALDHAVAYSSSLYEIATESKEQIAEIVEAEFAEVNKNVADALDEFAKNGPAGSDAALAAVKSAIAATSSAYNSMTKAAKQAAQIAESATHATVKAVGATAPKARKAA